MWLKELLPWSLIWILSYFFLKQYTELSLANQQMYKSSKVSKIKNTTKKIFFTLKFNIIFRVHSQSDKNEQRKVVVVTSPIIMKHFQMALPRVRKKIPSKFRFHFFRSMTWYAEDYFFCFHEELKNKRLIVKRPVKWNITLAFFRHFHNLLEFYFPNVLEKDSTAVVTIFFVIAYCHPCEFTVVWWNWVIRGLDFLECVKDYFWMNE